MTRPETFSAQTSCVQVWQGAKFRHMEAQTPQIVTVAVAAEEWGIDRRTALRWIAAGEVAATKVGEGRTNAYVLTRAEVERVKRAKEAA